MDAKRVGIIVVSSFISALAINVFFAPHKLLNGGVGGIALAVQYLFNLPAGYLVLILNIPLFFWSIKEVDKEFTLLTILGTVAESIFLVLTKDLASHFFLKDILLSCIYGGVIHGVAMGIIFSNHGSLGGADIVSVILRKKYNFEIGSVSLAINIFIVSLGSILFGVETGLYTLISMYLGFKVVDMVIKGFNRKNLMFIVSSHQEQITERIRLDLNRSSTILFGRGTFSGNEYDVIYCVISTSQVPKLKRIVMEEDPRAFMSIIDTSEVEGKGFKSAI